MKGKRGDRCKTVIQTHLLTFSYSVDMHTTIYTTFKCVSTLSLSLMYVIDHVCICELSVISLVIEPEYLVCG